MLKHVQLSPYRNRNADSVSLASSSPDSMSLSSNSRIPALDSRTSPVGCTTRRDRSSDTLSISSLSPDLLSSSLSSRSSSCCSLADATTPTTTIKVYCKCLRADIEYKTLRISYQTTCREVVAMLLNKFRMRHRDPNLFYLTMEVTLRKAGLRTVLALDEDTRPAALQACHPQGDSRLALQNRRGGLVKIYDNVLMPGSQYKSLLISERTTVDELIQILLNCYNSNERVEQFSLYEVCEDQEFQRKLHPDDCPLQVQHSWLPDMHLHFLIRRNPDYRRNNRIKLIQNSWTMEPPCTPYVNKRSMQITSLLNSRPTSMESRASLLDSRTSMQDSQKLSTSSSSRDDTRLSCYSDYDNYFYI